MKPFYLKKLVVLASIVVATNIGAVAQTSFSTPGGPYNYTVGPGVTSVGVFAAGAQGGNGNGGSGGKGGQVSCQLAVTPGQVLKVYVGGQGNNFVSYSSVAGGANGGGNGWSYGGGGGGASDIRVGGTAYTNRVLVAAGGGGGGYLCGGGEDGGGAGGGTSGSNGSYCNSFYGGYCGYGATATGPGAGASNGGSAGGLGVGGNSGSYNYEGQGGGGAGYYGGGGGMYYGGGGGGSSYTGGAGVTGATNTGNAQSGPGIVTICSPNLGTIVGNAPVCIGLTNTLTSTGSGGTWTSGSPGTATISSTGVVTGVAAGVATITYAASVAGCGSGFITVNVTVNPSPTAIIGTASACTGLSSTLSDAGGGTWSTSDATLASVVPATGVVTGISFGTPTITYTLPTTGCYITTPFVVYPLPASIVGSSTVCAAGATTVMTDPTPGGTWTSSNPGTATITAGSGIVTGGTAGVTNITYTLPTSCIATFTLSVNPLPSAIAGSSNVCSGSATTLSDAGGGSWSSANVSVAAVGPTGIVTGVAAGTTNIIYTLSTGCSISAPMLVNPLPLPIAGVLSFCNGGSSTLTDASPGGTWTSSNATLATVIPSSGFVNSVSSGIPVITYTLPTTCFTTVPVTINALPTPFAVTGGGAYCAGTGGVHIGLGLSSTGVSYKLFNGPTFVTTLGGSNSALDFGVYTAAGTYTVVGINTSTTCTSNMAGSTTISINPLPNTFNVTGGGNFCPGAAGVHVMQSGSVVGINYQLMVGGSGAGAAVAGTGTPLDFGPQTTPGLYTVVATNPSTGCSVNMVGSAIVSLNSLPPIHTINAGGHYCTGGSGIGITLDGSDVSVSYQLFYGTSTVGIPMTGTGSPLNFGLKTGAGAYSVVATSMSTGCVNNMAGTANIVTDPLPLVFFVTGGGGFCPGSAGVHVNLNYSTTGVNYQLYRGSSPVAGELIAGSNAGLDFGLQTVGGVYTVVAIDASSSCSANMSSSANVFVNPLPASHNVTGTGSYCTGGSGLHVGLDGSNTGISYQLVYGGGPMGIPVPGTGAALNFGLKTGVGTYTVVATNSTTSCSANMAGAANISVNSLPNVDSVITVGTSTSYCAGGTGIDILLNNSDMGVNYQVYRGGAASGSPIAGTGSPIDLGMHTAAGLYTVVATNTSTTCQASMAGGVNVAINPAPAVYVLTGGGNYCAGGVGAHIGLTGSTLGVNYTISNPGGPLGSVSGTGSALDFGLETGTGTYSVVATDGLSGCTSNMAGSVSVNINPLPTAFTVTGSGPYCAGSTGNHVYLSGSTAAFHYQLYNGTTPLGIYSTGLGSAIDFGTHTAGTYTVVATDPATFCTSSMNSSAVIVATPLPALQTVMGGGPYCAGTGGRDVSLSGSANGVNYQLVYGGTAIGGIVGGTGAAIDFGTQTGGGTYTVVATDTATFCTSNMTGGAVITITPQPSLETVTGTGAFCAGGTGVAVGLSGSNSGIQYQLMNGGTAVGSLVTGTGGTVSFGSMTVAGTYTVVASPGGLCQTNMTGSAVVTVSPLPTLYTVAGGGAYCSSDSGRAITLGGSNSGIHYQLFMGGAPVGSFVSGTGSALSLGLQTAAGIYTVVGTNSLTGCTSNMTGSAIITLQPAPVGYNVAGGGHYCAGGTGVAVMLNSSTTNVNYQLYRAGTALGTTMAGTGTSLNFGVQTVQAGYTVTGTDAVSGCTSNMADTANVTIDPIITPVISSISANPGVSVNMNQLVTFTCNVSNSVVANPTYQWAVNSFPVSGATNSTFASNELANNDVVSCTATSTGACADMTASKSVTMTVRNTTNVNQVVSANSDVKVLPNPNKGIFTITGSLGTNDDVDVTVEVLDVVGHVVYTEKTIARNGNMDNRIQLNGNIANGMYLLNLRSSVNNQVFHIVVEQ